MQQSDRLSEYILKAEGCAAQAKATASQPMRDSYLELEKQWRNLAKEASHYEPKNLK